MDRRRGGQGTDLTPSPRASAVVLNLNGGDLVIRCLETVTRQDFPQGLEVLVVDNGSTDGSREEIESKFPDVRVLPLGRNAGYSAGMNAGIDATSGEFLMLLNLDVELESDYLAECVAALDADASLGGVTGKLLKVVPGNILDTTGHVVYRNRRAVDRGEWEDDRGQYDDQTEVFGICGAAPCVRRKMLEDVSLGGEVLDEDFYIYFEDFDLSWRARLYGWRFGYVPSAIGRHHRGASGGRASTLILACNHRNRLLTMVKNDHPVSFLKALPGIAYTELRATLHMLWLRPAALVLAWFQFFRLLRPILRKRRAIQSSRRVGRRELEAWFTPYSYGVGATILRAKQRNRAAA